MLLFLILQTTQTKNVIYINLYNLRATYYMIVPQRRAS